MIDQQFEERERTYASRAHQLQRDKELLEQSNERLTRRLGLLFDEVCLLREECGGNADAAAHIRRAAYALVQADMEDRGIVGVNLMCTGEWRALGEGPDYAATKATLIAAVDAVPGDG